MIKGNTQPVSIYDQTNNALFDNLEKGISREEEEILALSRQEKKLKGKISKETKNIEERNLKKKKTDVGSKINEYKQTLNDISEELKQRSLTLNHAKKAHALLEKDAETYLSESKKIDSELQKILNLYLLKKKQEIQRNKEKKKQIDREVEILEKEKDMVRNKIKESLAPFDIEVNDLDFEGLEKRFQEKLSSFIKKKDQKASELNVQKQEIDKKIANLKKIKRSILDDVDKSIQPLEKEKDLIASKELNEKFDARLIKFTKSKQNSILELNIQKQEIDKKIANLKKIKRSILDDVDKSIQPLEKEKDLIASKELDEKFNAKLLLFTKNRQNSISELNSQKQEITKKISDLKKAKKSILDDVDKFIQPLEKEKDLIASKELDEKFNAKLLLFTKNRQNSISELNSQKQEITKKISDLKKAKSSILNKVNKSILPFEKEKGLVASRKLDKEYDNKLLQFSELKKKQIKELKDQIKKIKKELIILRKKKKQISVQLEKDISKVYRDESKEQDISQINKRFKKNLEDFKEEKRKILDSLKKEKEKINNNISSLQTKKEELFDQTRKAHQLLTENKELPDIFKNILEKGKEDIGNYKDSLSELYKSKLMFNKQSKKKLQKLIAELDKLYAKKKDIIDDLDKKRADLKDMQEIQDRYDSQKIKVDSQLKSLKTLKIFLTDEKNKLSSLKKLSSKEKDSIKNLKHSINIEERLTGETIKKINSLYHSHIKSNTKKKKMIEEKIDQLSKKKALIYDSLKKDHENLENIKDDLNNLEKDLKERESIDNSRSEDLISYLKKINKEVSSGTIKLEKIEDVLNKIKTDSSEWPELIDSAVKKKRSIIQKLDSDKKEILDKTHELDDIHILLAEFKKQFEAKKASIRLLQDDALKERSEHKTALRRIDSSLLSLQEDLKIKINNIAEEDTEKQKKILKQHDQLNQKISNINRLLIDKQKAYDSDFGKISSIDGQIKKLSLSIKNSTENLKKNKEILSSYEKELLSEKAKHRSVSEEEEMLSKILLDIKKDKSIKEKLDTDKKIKISGFEKNKALIIDNLSGYIDRLQERIDKKSKEKRSLLNKKIIDDIGAKKALIKKIKEKEIDIDNKINAKTSQLDTQKDNILKRFNLSVIEKQKKIKKNSDKNIKILNKKIKKELDNRKAKQQLLIDHNRSLKQSIEEKKAQLLEQKKAFITDHRSQLSKKQDQIKAHGKRQVLPIDNYIRRYEKKIDSLVSSINKKQESLDFSIKEKKAQLLEQKKTFIADHQSQLSKKQDQIKAHGKRQILPIDNHIRHYEKKIDSLVSSIRKKQESLDLSIKEKKAQLLEQKKAFIDNRRSQLSKKQDQIKAYGKRQVLPIDNHIRHYEKKIDSLVSSISKKQKSLDLSIKEKKAQLLEQKKAFIDNRRSLLSKKQKDLIAQGNKKIGSIDHLILIEKNNKKRLDFLIEKGKQNIIENKKLSDIRLKGEKDKLMHQKKQLMHKKEMIRSKGKEKIDIIDSEIAFEEKKKRRLERSLKENLQKFKKISEEKKKELLLEKKKISHNLSQVKNKEKSSGKNIHHSKNKVVSLKKRLFDMQDRLNAFYASQQDIDSVLSQRRTDILELSNLIKKRSSLVKEKSIMARELQQLHNSLKDGLVKNKASHHIVKKVKEHPVKDGESMKVFLKKMDGLLGKLPQKDIDKFARSKDFRTYTEIMSKYNIK